MYGGRCKSVDDVVGRVWGEREEIKKKEKKKEYATLVVKTAQGRRRVGERGRYEKNTFCGC